mgnify:CR=1 FL=1|jgi:hypothetical protein
MNESKIRFKGFEGEWEKVKADAIFKTVNERNRPDTSIILVCHLTPKLKKINESEKDN